MSEEKGNAGGWIDSTSGGKAHPFHDGFGLHSGKAGTFAKARIPYVVMTSGEVMGFSPTRFDSLGITKDSAITQETLGKILLHILYSEQATHLTIPKGNGTESMPLAAQDTLNGISAKNATARDKILNNLPPLDTLLKTGKNECAVVGSDGYVYTMNLLRNPRLTKECYAVGDNASGLKSISELTLKLKPYSVPEGAFSDAMQSLLSKQPVGTHRLTLSEHDVPVLAEMRALAGVQPDKADIAGLVAALARPGNPSGPAHADKYGRHTGNGGGPRGLGNGK